jgi:hypothetical protein
VRVAGLAVALLALACATTAPTPTLEVESFALLPGFEPTQEFVPQANRKLAIMSEGEGRLTSGQRFYYIAYLTDEGLPAQEPLRSHALWGEMQSLWKKRRAALDATQYELVFIDARVFPGTPGSRTLRTVYEAKDGYWSGEEVASFVIEETDLP